MLLKSDGSPYSARELTPQAWSAFFATQESSSRGRMVLMPQDTRQTLSPWSLDILRLKSRTLVENFGPAKALQYISWLVGPLRPNSTSGDPKWSALAEKRFAEIVMEPLLFHTGGRLNFYQAQTRIGLYHPWVDGDAFSIFTRSRAGFGAVALREGHNVQQPANADDSWNNGVKLIDDSYPAGYFFAARNGTGRALPSSAVHHHGIGGYAGLDSTRGFPVLAHAINNFHDIIETTGFLKAAIKTAAQVGLSVRQADANSAIGDMAGLTVSLSQNQFQPPDYSGGITPPAPKTASYEDVMSGSVVSRVPLEALHDDRPHPNQMEFKNSLLREAAQGLHLPPEVMYFMDAPGGTDLRFKIEVLAKFIANCHRDHILPWCQKMWNYIIGIEMAEGRLPYPSQGEYTKVRWTPQKDISVDFGRMGKLYIELRKHLMFTFQRFFASLSYEWEDELEQMAIEERKMIDLEEKYDLPKGRLSEKLASHSNVTASFDEQPAAA